MRLDFILYGVAIVLFVIAAILAVIIPSSQGQIFYSAATAVLAILVAATGYVVRPRTEKPKQVSPVSPPPQPEAGPVQPSIVESQVAPAPEPQVPTVETPPPPPVETPPVEKAPVQKSAEPNEPMPVLLPPEPTPKLSAPPEVPAIEASPSMPVMDLTQIRGINAKRVEQLKTNGINSVEDLANASPEELAAKLDLSPRVVKMWVGSAKKLAK